MAPAGGGRSQVTDRMLRHLCLIGVTPFDDKSLSLIFNSIMEWHLNKKPAFSSTVRIRLQTHNQFCSLHSFIFLFKNVYIYWAFFFLFL